jgi:hypothetical protein
MAMYTAGVGQSDGHHGVLHIDRTEKARSDLADGVEAGGRRNRGLDVLKALM